MMTRFFIFLIAFGATVCAAPIPIHEVRRDERVDFAREIYPLLKRNCLACHNSTKAKADLNLESPALMRKGGESGPAIVAGKSGESLVLKSAAHLDDPPMPPPGNKVKASNLSSEELGLLKLWIDQGAEGAAVAVEKGPLPWRNDAEHGDAVNALAISPEGRLTAIARGNTVQLCEVATGRIAEQLCDPDLNPANAARPIADPDAVMSLAFANEDLLATGGFRTVRTWRRMPRAIKRDYGALPEDASAIALSGDGRWAAVGSAKGTVALCALDSEKFEPIELKEFSAPVACLAFAPAGGFLVAASEDGNVAAWRIADRAIVWRIHPAAAVRSMVFNRAGNEMLTGGVDGTVRAWTTPSDENAAPTLARELKISDAPLVAICPAEEGAFWWIGADQVMHLSSALDGTETRRITPEHPGARPLAAAEYHLKVAQATRQSRAARLTSIADRLKKESESVRTTAQTAVKRRSEWQQQLDARFVAEEMLREMPADKGRIDAAKKAGDAERKAETAARAAKVDAEIATRLFGASAQEHAVAQGEDAAAEAALAAGQAARDAAARQLAEPLPAPRMMSLATDGQSALICDSKGQARKVALADGALIESLRDAGFCTFFATGDILAVGTDKHFKELAGKRVWARESVIGNPDDPTILEDRVNTLAFSPDAKLIATGGGTPSRSGELKLWRTDGTLVRAIARAHADTINALAFSPDGDLIATAGSDRLAAIWSSVDGARLASFEGHAGHVLSIAWRADGLVLATGGADKTVRTWDLLTRKQIKATTNFGGEICAVRFVGSGDLILAAAGDRTIRLGDQALPDSGSAYPFCAASDRAGEVVGAGSHDGKVRFWKVADRKLMRTLDDPTAAGTRTAAAP